MKRLLLVVAFLLVAVSGFAQTATVTRNVNLRPTASTEQSAITLLTPGAQLELLLAAPTNGFYRVRTADGKEGWVWGSNIRIQPTAAAPPPPPPSGCPPTGTHTVNGKEVPYAADSDGGLRNAAKKHVPTSQNPVLLTFQDFTRLQADANQLLGDAHTKKSQIKPNRDALRNLVITTGSVNEGQLVELMGFVVANSKQGAESVNCGGSDGYDFHINVGPTAASTEFQGIVVEMIPQGRTPEWTIPGLTAARQQHLPVLVVGGLLYDNEHLVNDDPSQPKGGQPKRFSLWEIHPITEFLVCEQAGGCDPVARAQWTALSAWVKKHPTNN